MGATRTPAKVKIIVGILAKDIPAIEAVRAKGWELSNIDATVCAQEPKLNPHIEEMRTCLASVLGVDVDDVSIKATTTEHLGFVGRKEGIAAYATALLINR